MPPRAARDAATREFVLDHPTDVEFLGLKKRAADLVLDEDFSGGPLDSDVEGNLVGVYELKWSFMYLTKRSGDGSRVNWQEMESVASRMK